MKKKLAILTMSAISVMSTGVVAFADMGEPQSMLDSVIVGVIQDFSADIIPTVTHLISIIVPVGLSLWGIGFAVKKGINFLQRRAKQSI